MTQEELTEAGFVKSTDPQFVYEFDLSDNTDTFEEHDYKPALLWDNIACQFCVTDGEVMFIYFNAISPKEAIEWASKITMFEVN